MSPEDRANAKSTSNATLGALKAARVQLGRVGFLCWLSKDRLQDDMNSAPVWIPGFLETCTGLDARPRVPRLQFP